MITLYDLKRFRAEQREMKQLFDQLETIKSAIYFPHGQNLDGQPKGGSDDRLLNMLAKKDAIETLLEINYTELLERHAEIENAIAHLDEPIERIIVRMRFIDGWSWLTISNATNYSERQAKRIIKKAVGKLMKDGTP